VEEKSSLLWHFVQESVPFSMSTSSAWQVPQLSMSGKAMSLGFDFEGLWQMSQLSPRSSLNWWLMMMPWWGLDASSASAFFIGAATAKPAARAAKEAAAIRRNSVRPGAAAARLLV
jgi:hypothetical protein